MKKAAERQPFLHFKLFKNKHMKLFKAFIATFFLLSLNICNIQAQMVVVGSESILDRLRLNKGINGVETALYSNINGDPYIFKGFQKGTLTVNSGEKFEVNLRYDIYANEMHLKDKNEIYAIIHPEKVKLIEIDSLRFIYCGDIKSSEEETPKEGLYFILKTDGRCKLLVKKNIRVQDAEPPKLYQEAKPAKFILTNDTYFLKLEDKSAVKIKNKKELLSVLNDQKEALNVFMSSNKLDVKTVKDLIKIVTFYNGL